ncbi:MAG TPA: DUF378 domain-containing protein [Candidatus Paceibacterota bacterium]|nr:DUF378 domain-containing protein [Candidatus Paceibacterota bacterium]
MTCNCKGKCVSSKIAWILVVIGGLNWGIIGLGMLMGSDWNVVSMLLGSWPIALSIVYLLVGIATLVKLFGCPCKKCKEGCKDCQVEAPTPKM